MDNKQYNLYLKRCREAKKLNDAMEALESRKSDERKTQRFLDLIDPKVVTA